MELDNVISRIKKCLALSASSNEHEAAAALRQAQKLMAQYNVSEEGLVQADITTEEADCPSAWMRPPAWEVDLCSLIGRAFGCQLILFTNSNQSKLPRHLRKLARFGFVGLKHQAQLAVYTYQVLRRQCIRARERYVSGLPPYCSRGDKINRGEAFCVGFIDNVRKQVHALALTPAQQDAIQAVKDKRLGHKPGRYQAPKRDLPYSAYEAGKEAGEDASLHRPVQEKEQAALRRLTVK